MADLNNDPYLSMAAMIADEPPPPRVHMNRINPTPIRFSVELLDELLRNIFEIIANESMYHARHLILVSRWVRTWLLQTYFAAQTVATHPEAKKLLHRPDSILAHIRSLRVGVADNRVLGRMLGRTPNVERLAVQPAMICMPEYIVATFPSRLATTLKELEVTWKGVTSLSIHLDHSAFARLTHLRLGYSQQSTVDQLAAEGEEAVLRELTHLAFSAEYLDEGQGDPYIMTEECVIQCKQVLRSRTRDNLCVLALTFKYDSRPQEKVYTAAPRLDHWSAFARRGTGARYQLARYVVEKGIPRLWVLESTVSISPALDWRRRGMGKLGFWERVETQGYVAGRGTR